MTNLTDDFSVSVVVPTYNRASLLAKTLEAILAQTVPPLEIIVVDDGSSDNTGEVLERYPPVRALRIKNSGELVARNTGLREAKGELVAFCDSDDLWKPEFLERSLELWRTEPGINVTYGNFVILSNDVLQKREKFSYAPPGYWDCMRRINNQYGVFDESNVNQLIEFNPFFPSCMIVRRHSFLALGGWDESVGRTVSCDLATTLLMCEHGKVGVLFEPLVIIRKHGGNYSADVQAVNLGDAYVLEKCLNSRASLRPYKSVIEKSILSRRLQAFDIAFSRKDFVTVKKIIDLLHPDAFSKKQKMKAFITTLPESLRAPIAEFFLFLGSATSLHRRYLAE
jgi:glycosyltransferase involved in cell wall biosynthesis